MSRERFLEFVRFCFVGRVSLVTDNAILQNFCDRNHDFEAELAAVTSSKVLNLLAEKNISAVNFSALRAQNVS